MTERGETQLNYRQYPLPLASHDEVVRNPTLFMETLEKLHATMGTKFMVPIIGGKELDLHRLFVEVTSRGGLDKIIRDRRWKDVTAVFSFPSTATNASFVLRKYYISLMHHYEQIYFFGARGWVPPPAASLPTPSSTPAPPHGVFSSIGPISETHAGPQKRRRSMGDSLPSGYPVVGVIDGKFEHGYLVTVTVGAQKLRGVLYHASEHSPAQVSPISGGAYKVNEVTGTSAVRHRRRRRKKSEMRKKDPSHPRPNRSGYNFFFAEQHARLKPLHPGKDREISRMIGELWNNLTETEKAVYQERGVKDKERYRSEMEEYRERLKTGGTITAVPLQEPLVIPEASSTMNAVTKIEVEGLPENESSSEESGSEEEEEEEEEIAEKTSVAEILPEAGVDSQSCSISVAEGYELEKVDHGAKATDIKDSSPATRSEPTKNENVVVGATETVKDAPEAALGVSESSENAQIMEGH